ncbi:hypothetical protein [Clostridium perfringens]
MENILNKMDGVENVSLYFLKGYIQL